MARIVAYRPGLCHPAEVPSSRRTIVAWTLYDFANSSFAAIILATIYPAFYANLVVGNATGRGDFLWGAAISTAMIIGALTSPLLGGIADHAGARKRFFIGFTVVSVVTTALMATVRPGVAGSGGSEYAIRPEVVWGWVLAVVGVVTYEAATVYYNSYLPRIARPDQLGRVSAAGFAVGYAGSLVAFLAAYPFAVAEAFWGCFLSAAVLFAVFSLPSFLILPADQRHPMPIGVAAARGARLTLATLREIVRSPDRVHMRRFLASYLIYEDGVNTVVTFAGVFAAKTLGFSFKEIILLFMLVQISALAGSAAWARPTDARGPRFVVRVTLVQWALVTLLAFFVQAKWHFWVVAVLAGTGLGAVQAASRTFMATLVPREREAEFFGFYALVGKTGAVLGPVVFGLVSWLLSGNQRVAIVAVGLFFVVGFFLVGRVGAGGPLDSPGNAAPLGT
jgi:MFS transporter, UMF1 family